MGKKTPKYTYTQHPDATEWGAIRIKSGSFKDFVFHYGVVSFSEESDSHCGVNFTYNIVDNPNHHPENEEMREMMGNILIEMLIEKYGDNDGDRAVDTIESGAE